MSENTSSRIPNGAATLNPNTSRPMGDHNKIGIESNAATTKRFRMFAVIASIDIPVCPPWPITSVGERPSGGEAC